MDIEKYIQELNERDVHLWVEDGAVKYRAPRNVINGEIVSFISDHKQEFITALHRPREVNGLNSFFYCPASTAQKRMYAAQLMDPGSNAYNVSDVVKFNHRIDHVRLKNALNEIVRRHESLRTSFAVVNDSIVQKVHVRLELEVERKAVDTLDIDLERAEFSRAFDLEKLPLIRAKILSVGSGASCLFIEKHHVITDVESDQIFIRELRAAYAGERLPPLSRQFKDYAIWQNNWSKTAECVASENFWKNEFAGEVPVLNFPQDFERRGTRLGGQVRLKLDREINDRIRVFSITHRITANVFLLGVVKLLLSKYAMQEQIIVGIPLNCRREQLDDGQIGMFVNTIAISTHLDSTQPCDEYLKALMTKFLACLNHRHYDFDSVLNSLKCNRIAGRHPLFDVMFEYHKVDMIDRMANNGEEPVDGQQLMFGTNEAKFDLLIMAYQGDDAIDLTIEYNATLYRKESIEYFIQQYGQLVLSVLKNPRTPLGHLTFAENEGRLVGIGAACGERKAVGSFLNDILGSVRRNQKKVAIRFGDQVVTYGLLLDRCGRVHSFMKDEIKAEPQSLVGVLMNRSDRLIGVALGLMMSGAVYLPIDPSYPESRSMAIIADSGLEFLIYEKACMTGSLSEKIRASGVRMIEYQEIDAINALRSELPRDFTDRSETDLAYVIYTSGSTGTPKGAMIEYNGMMNHIQAKIDIMRVDETSIMAQNASQGFDISIWQFFVTILAGGEVVVYPDEVVMNIPLFLERLNKDKITVLELVPTFMSLIVDEMENNGTRLDFLKTVVVQGETLMPGLARRWLKHNQNSILFNAWGTTEVSDDVTHYLVDREDDFVTVPIGKPIPNSDIYILDKASGVCPVGIKGEICVGGVAVGRGYLNSPEKTAARFDNLRLGGGVPVRIYRTGDIGRFRADGNLEIFGRMDSQVKIHGFRIELEEIEKCILGHPDVIEAVVLCHKDKSDEPFLSGYLRVKVTGEGIEASVKSYLKSKLPHYMVPAHFVEMTAFPVTPNGKIDRKAFPNPLIENGPLRDSVGQGKEDFYDSVEQDLGAIWKEVLKVSGLGPSDNFFDLGGNSISAIRIVSRSRQVFGRDMQIRTIFENPTVRRLAVLLRNPETAKGIGRFEHLVQVERRESEEFPLSPIQYPVWYLLELKPDSVFYNISMVFDLKGAVLKDVLLQSINDLLASRDVFKIQFSKTQAQVRQKYVGPQVLTLNDFYVDFRGKDSTALKDELVTVLNAPMDLSKAPIARFKLYQVADNHFKLAFVTSHIIWDQLTTLAFCDELSSTYNQRSRGEKLAVAHRQYDYLDYCVWHHRLVEEGRLEASRKYWLERFSDLPKPLELPMDFKRPEQQSFTGGRVAQYLTLQEKKSVDLFCARNETTYQIFFLSVLSLWIYRMSGQSDFIVGTPMSNRVSEGFDKVFGLFASALPIRCSLKGDWNFASLLAYIGRVSLEAYDHHLYPMSKLVAEIGASREVSPNQFIRVFFGVQNDESELAEIRLNGVAVDELNEELGAAVEGNSHFDFTFQIDHRKDMMRLSINYSADLYRRETARKQVEQLLSLLRQCIENPGLPMGSYSLLLEQEQEVIQRFINNPDQSEVPNIGIGELFERATKEFAQEIAVISDQGTHSYQELGERVEKMANRLHARGIRAGHRVGVWMPPSVEAIISIVALLRMGAVYVPVSEEVPVRRLSAIVDSAGIKQVIYCPSMIPCSVRTEDSGISLWDYDEILKGAEKIGAFEPGQVVIDGESPAYFIFTSGTTGRPKGIRVQHRGVGNLIESTRRYYGFNRGDVSLFYTPINFDASVIDIFLPLLSGGKVVVMDPKTRKSVREIHAAIARHGVTFVQFVPAVLDEFLSICEDLKGSDTLKLKHVISGGAPLSRSIRDRFFRRFCCRLTNNYGPTEVTVDATRFDCSNPFEGNLVPIGVPISNVDIFILDFAGNVVPIGVIGEICVRSIGNFSGYENGEKVDASCFLNFKSVTSGEVRLFRTGDFGAYHADGNIYYHGRRDGQIKVNGNRVEVEEVEAALLSLEPVKDAGVLPQERSGFNWSMVGFVELADNKKIVWDAKNGTAAYTLEQNITVKREMWSLHAKAWPAFFKGSAVVQNHWGEMVDLFPELQICLLNQSNEVCAIGNAVAVNWDGQTGSLPAGWDDAIIQGIALRKGRGHANTVVVLAAVVDPANRKAGLSRAVIQSYRSIAAALGYSYLLVALRPLAKEDCPELGIERYVTAQAEGALKADLWLSMHQRLGGKIVGFSEKSQKVAGSLSDWSRWTGRIFETAGRHRVDKALSLVEVDIDHDLVTYYDPCIWVEHGLTDDGCDARAAYVSPESIRKDLLTCLPAYAVPQRLVIMNKLPLQASGKVNKTALNLAGIESDDSLVVEPGTATEKALCEIFGTVLRRRHLSIHQNFFDAGGHSLTALELIYRINEAFGVEFRLSDLFAFPSVFRLSQKLEPKFEAPNPLFERSDLQDHKR